jgi:hypothetical protein
MGKDFEQFGMKGAPSPDGARRTPPLDGVEGQGLVWLFTRH